MTWQLREDLSGHPFVVPAVVSWWVVLVGITWWARRKAVLAGRPGPGLLPLLFWGSVGTLAAVTLTPAIGAARPREDASWCLRQWPQTGFGLWAANPERRGNVLLGVPIGAAAALCLAQVWGTRRSLPGWRRRPAVIRSTVVVTVALGCPFALEYAQRRFPLGRTCAVVDLVDNLSGVLLGAVVVVGLVLAKRLAAGQNLIGNPGPRPPSGPKP